MVTGLRGLCRCHPVLAAAPNAHFYAGKLLNGSSPDQRASLVPGLPPLVFVDVRGQHQGSSTSGSIANHAEAATVVAALCQLSAAGISSSAMGVICFFRAQVLANMQLVGLA